ncbi:MAG: SDR family oxidoreductase [Phycisphaerae bacterium]
MEKLEPKLKGKVALVTGAARGLGRAFAIRLARLAADVAVNDIDLAAASEFGEELTAETVMDECRAFGVRSIGIEADVSRRDNVEKTVARVVDELGSLDILVANAGGMLLPSAGGRADAATMPEEDVRFILDVNLMSTIFCCQAAAAAMRPRGWGRIVTVSSTAAFGAGHGLVSYGTAKAAVLRYTRALAKELGPHGVNVNCIAPCIIGTSRALGQFPERRDLAKDIPLGRIGEPEDCAKVIEFFCTDLADYVTGQCLVVCGGMHMHAS